MPKTWFITGATSGLGLEMAQQLLAEEHRVIATARRPDALAQLRRDHPACLDVVQLDLAEPESITSAIESAFERNERIDVIVSNAGYGLFGAAEELTNAQIDRQIATNLAGSIHLIRAALPFLRTQGGGRIVQVSSEGGQIAYPGFSLYHATKWGIEGFVEIRRAGSGSVSASTSSSPSRDRPVRISVPTSTARHAMDAYEETPAGAVRRAISDGSFEIKGRRGAHRSRNHISRRERDAAIATGAGQHGLFIYLTGAFRAPSCP